MPQCPTCGSDVSEQALFCPDCGTDLKPAGGAPEGDPGGSADVSVGGVPAASVPDVVSPSGEMPAAGSVPAAAATAPMEPEGASPEPAASQTSAPISEMPRAETPAAAPAAGSVPAAGSAPPAGAASPGAARLTLKRSGALTSEVFQVGGRVVIGRFDPETGPVDVDLGSLPESTYVSRQHAEIWQDGAQWRIKDLGSRNGVFVRRQGEGSFRRAAGEETLGSGDEIALGNARFEFRIG